MTCDQYGVGPPIAPGATPGGKGEKKREIGGDSTGANAVEKEEEKRI